MEVEKVYSYVRDNKTITIKRKWNRINSVQQKKDTFNKYITDHNDELHSGSIAKHYRNYINEVDDPLSESTFYKSIKKIRE